MNKYMRMINNFMIGVEVMIIVITLVMIANLLCK